MTDNTESPATGRTWTDIASEWTTQPSACPGSPPEGHALLGDIVQDAVDDRRIAYLTGVRESGKTAVMMTMARLAALHWSLPVTFVSAEAPTYELQAMMLAGASGVPIRKVNRFDLGRAERIKVHEARERISAARLQLHGWEGITIGPLAADIRRIHPISEPGIVFVDGLGAILRAEREVNPDFTVEELMTNVRIRSKSAFIASGWLDTHWSEMVNRDNPVPKWTDVPEPVEWTFPHIIALGKRDKSNIVSLRTRFNGDDATDKTGLLAVQGFYARAVDHHERGRVTS